MALQVTGQKTTTGGLPEWAAKMQQDAAGAAYSYVIDPVTNQPRPMQPYDGPLQAATNPLLAQSQGEAAGMNGPDYSTVNRYMIEEAARSSNQYRDPNSINFNASYNPNSYETGPFSAQDVKFNDTLAGFNPEAYGSTAATFNAPDFAARDYNFNAERVGAGSRGAIRDVSAPGAGSLNSYLMGPADQVSAPQLNEYLMQLPPDVRAQIMGPAAQWTDAGVQQKYMDPYAGAVTDIQQRKAKESFYEELAREGGRAAAAGAFGGSRQGVVEGAMTRDYAQLGSDIQQQGLAAAYKNAQEVFGSDRAAAMQGRQFDISNALQADLANQQTALTGGQANLQSQLQTQGLRANTGLQAAIANQGANLDVGKSNQAAQLGVQQLGTQAGLQASLANQRADVDYAGMGLDAQKANQAAALQAEIEGSKLGSSERQYGAGLSQAAAIRQAELNQQTSLANQQAKLAAQQLGFDAKRTQYQGGLQAGIANQAAGIDMTKLGEQSKQFGFQQRQQGDQFSSDLNLRNQQAQQDAINATIRNNLTASNQSADIFNKVGQNDHVAFEDSLAANKNRFVQGAAQQAADQSANDRQFQLWQMQQAYPMLSMQQLSQILNQTTNPFATSKTTEEGLKQNPWLQFAGLAIAGAGAAGGLGVKI